MQARDQIYLDIMANGWSDKYQAFMQSYGSETPGRQRPHHAAGLLRRPQ